VIVVIAMIVLATISWSLMPLLGDPEGRICGHSDFGGRMIAWVCHAGGVVSLREVFSLWVSKEKTKKTKRKKILKYVFEESLGTKIFFKASLSTKIFFQGLP
jgi:hypothetical protein